MNPRELFTPERIEAVARMQFSTDTFGDELYREPLRVLTQAIADEAGIEDIRLMRTSMQLVFLLGLRARIARALAAHPEVRERPIDAPIFIVGLPRTGTTLLQNLLAGHPDHRAPLLWEMRAPVRPEGAPASWDEQAIAEARGALAMLEQAIPNFGAIHPMSATGPDECSWLFRPNFTSLVYAFMYRIPSYYRWITSIDMEPYYRAYRESLQLMAWQRPGARRWVLKDPCHLWHLDAIASVFPGARVLLLHRTMTETLASMASLFHTLHSVESSNTDARELAPYCSMLAERGVYGMMQLRDALPGIELLDVDYRELVASPRRTLERICEFAGSSRRPEDLDAMLGWLAANRQHQSGKHEYSLAQFGFDAARVRAQFARYEATYIHGS